MKHTTLLLAYLTAVVGAEPKYLQAQEGTPSSPPPSQNQVSVSDQTVQMSAFEVTTTQGHGYVSNNAVSAYKTDESLMNIPQADIVVTNDLIVDLNYENTSDTLQYVGVYAGYQGESTCIRGEFVQEYVDDCPYDDNFDCNNFIDSYEIIKGPAETLYLNASLGGMALKTTKKPLPYNQDIITASIDQWGLYRFSGDFTGPLGRIGDAELSYRLCTLYQDGNTYFTNIVNDRYDIIPELQIRYHDTSVRAYYNFTHVHGEYDGVELLLPNGNLYTGWGRSESNQPPNNMIENEARTLFVEALQKLSTNWETKLVGDYWNDFYANPYLEPDDIDWDNDTEQLSAFTYTASWKYWTILSDTQGHYDIGTVPNRDAFGFGYSNWVLYDDYATNAPFGTDNVLTVPVNTPAAINSVLVPAKSEFEQPNQFGTRYEYNLSSIYWQHTVDIIPDWLTLLAGYTWETIELTTVPDTAMTPWQSTTVPESQWLHRLGAVAHLGKDVSLYVLDSTSFTPSGGAPLESGLQAPPHSGIGTELGIKWNFLGGRISGEAAWFRLVTTNNLTIAGTFPNGELYVGIVGTSVEEGVDGDTAITIVPGWQLIGSFYSGHNRDTFDQPIPGSWDNSLAIFSRYDFNKSTALKGCAVGGGVTRIGGRWMNNEGLTYSAYPVPPEVKVQTGTLVNGFVSYDITKHWMFRVNCQNILNQAYPLNVETMYIVDPSPPRTWSFESTYKF